QKSYSLYFISLNSFAKSHIFLLQANIWIIIFSYVGNYFWTHYFFTVLGASYTFPSWRMNNVRLSSCYC
ncbi:Os11g0302500, partial [Oryza sativa Japonica Group]